MKAYSVAAGTQERHRGPTMAPLALRNAIAGLQWALRNAIPGTEWGRWHSGMPFPGRNGAAGMALMLNNKKLMPRYSRLLKKIRVFVAGL